MRLAVTDGLVVRTERATYTENGGLVDAPGPIAFSRGRLSGTALGLTYDKTADLVTLLDKVVVRMSPDAAGAGGLVVTAGTAALNRIDHVMRFERGMKAVRGTETTEADVGSARLSADEERLEALELRGNSRMTGAKTGAGGLEALSGRDIDLTYLPDGQTLQHVLVAGDAAIQLAGASGHAGRRITSNLVDIALGPDGSSPTALTARENVELTIPAEPDALARTIRAQTLDGIGEAGKGLTSARFAGNVIFRERGPDINREARSAGLQVALTPGVERDRRRVVFRCGPFHGPPDDGDGGGRPIYRDERHARPQRHRAENGNAPSGERAARRDGDQHRRDACRPVAARRRRR